MITIKPKIFRTTNFIYWERSARVEQKNKKIPADSIGTEKKRQPTNQ